MQTLIYNSARHRQLLNIENVTDITKPTFLQWNTNAVFLEVPCNHTAMSLISRAV